MNVRIKFLSHQVCDHSMVRRDGDDSSCGSYCDTIREAGGVKK